MEKVKRDKAVQITMTQEQYSVIEEKAIKLGVSVPFFMCAAALQTTSITLVPLENTDKEPSMAES